MVAVGGLIVAIVYTIFALIIKFKGIEAINKIFPASIVGAITMVIGLNLATFLVTYTHNSAVWEIVLAFITMLVIAIVSHYSKGFTKTIPFLIGLGVGYILALLVTLFNWAELVDFSAFNTLSWYPDVTFLKWHASDFTWSNLL